MQYRIDDTLNPLDFHSTSDLEALANRTGAHCYRVTAYCQHGRTRAQECHLCENGYVDDGHVFANPRSTPLMAMVEDDGETVIYIPERDRSKLRKVIPSLDEKVNRARKYNYGGNYFGAGWVPHHSPRST